MKYLIRNNCWDINKDYNVDKLLYLLIDRPNFINKYGSVFWYNNTYQQHRNYDLPAIIWVDGDCYWCKNDRFERKVLRPY